MTTEKEKKENSHVHLNLNLVFNLKKLNFSRDSSYNAKGKWT
jgi:hypothetical protein